MNCSFRICIWILILIAFPWWVHPDPFEDNNSWHSVFFSDNESGEEEAILRAMERAFRGRSRSFVPSTASSIDDDGVIWDRSYDDSFLSSSFYDDDDANDEVAQLDPGPRNLPTDTLKRTRNLASNWTNSTADRSDTQINIKPSVSVSERSERNKNEDRPTLGLQYIPMSNAYLASSEGPKVFSFTPVLSINHAGTAHKACTSPARVASTEIQDSKQSSTAHTPKAPSPVISPWVRRFLSKCQKDVLLPVPRDFIVDNFNLVLLPDILEMDSTTFRQAWKLLVSSKEGAVKPANTTLESAATSLFLRLHQRFLLSHRGMDMVRRRLLASPIFGRCPLPCCKGTPLLPIGFEDDCGSSSPPRKAQRYCFTCRNLWMHWDSMVPGCAWGDSFCHLFVLEYGPEVFGLREASKGIASKQQVEPQIFGFKLHPSAKYG